MKKDYNHFEMIEERLNSINSIEELFELWEMAHETEDEESCYNTICDGEIGKNGKKLYIPKNSFIADGYISEHGNKEFNGILFVLKEANVLKWGISTSSEHGYVENNLNPQYDFYRKYISDGINLNQSKQQEKMGRMAYYLTYKKMPKEDDKFKQALLNSAFINLNKRGGANQSKKIENYVDKYQNFIRKQINIIKPKIIICLGTYSYLNRINITEDYKCYNIWHTAYQMSRKERNRKYKLKDANVDLYMEEFIKRVNL